LLSKYLKKKVQDIPQVLTLYKEVLELYKEGLEVPEDITLIWPDDNYGYIKNLSNANEQKRLGGSGVYYHASYWGARMTICGLVRPTLRYCVLKCKKPMN
jgi:hypothetical protein